MNTSQDKETEKVTQMDRQCHDVLSFITPEKNDLLKLFSIEEQVKEKFQFWFQQQQGEQQEEKQEEILHELKNSVLPHYDQCPIKQKQQQSEKCGKYQCYQNKSHDQKIVINLRKSKQIILTSNNLKNKQESMMKQSQEFLFFTNKFNQQSEIIYVKRKLQNQISRIVIPTLQCLIKSPEGIRLDDVSAEINKKCYLGQKETETIQKRIYSIMSVLIPLKKIKKLGKLYNLPQMNLKQITWFGQFFQLNEIQKPQDKIRIQTHLDDIKFKQKQCKIKQQQSRHLSLLEIQENFISKLTLQIIQTVVKYPNGISMHNISQKIWEKYYQNKEKNIKNIHKRVYEIIWILVPIKYLRIIRKNQLSPTQWTIDCIFSCGRFQLSNQMEDYLMNLKAILTNQK